MAKVEPRKLTARQQAMADGARAKRAASADVVRAAYEGIKSADWEEAREEAALDALVSIVRAAFKRDPKHDRKRLLIEEHAKALPSYVVKAVRAADAARDKLAAERHAAKPAKPTSKEKALAAQPDQDDADADGEPDAEAVVAVVKGVKEAERKGIVPKGTAKATVKKARLVLPRAA